MIANRRFLLSFVWAILMASALSAQTIRREGELVLHAYTLRNRPATEAIQIVFPLLSKKGTVELQPATNTLVVRDTPAALSRIIPALRGYDHPPQPLVLDLYIVWATRAGVSGAPPDRSDVPEPLASRLRALLPYDVYRVQAQARLSSREGEAVTYALGGEYEVSFRLGTVAAGSRVRLSNFRVLRRTAEHPTGAALLHSNLTLPLEQTTSVVLTRKEASREALMLVLTLRPAGQRAGQAAPP